MTKQQCALAISMPEEIFRRQMVNYDSVGTALLGLNNVRSLGFTQIQILGIDTLLSERITRRIPRVMLKNCEIGKISVIL